MTVGVLPRPYNTDVHIWVTVAATASEVESPPLRLKIDWDGQWDAGASEMARHLIIHSESTPTTRR
jgi:hypothetical protein